MGATKKIGQQIRAKIGDGSFHDIVWKRRYMNEYSALRRLAMTDEEIRDTQEYDRLAQERRRKRLREQSITDLRAAGFQMEVTDEN